MWVCLLKSVEMWVCLLKYVEVWVCLLKCMIVCVSPYSPGGVLCIVEGPRRGCGRAIIELQEARQHTIVRYVV